MYGARTVLREPLEDVVSAWPAEEAAQKARAAYRYVKDVFYPKDLGYEPLEPHTDAAYEAERADYRPSVRLAESSADMGEAAGLGS